MAELVEVASGLSFPEGPIAMPDGSVLLVEMFAGRLTRVNPDGSKETIAELPGGPNGAAIGPGGTVFVCNNGGTFTPLDLGGIVIPWTGPLDHYLGGRIQSVDLRTGEVTELYTECDGHPLRGPNDLVFDEHGGFYFTDNGLTDESQRVMHMTGILYAKADGSEIREVVFPARDPNGIGLSPDGTKLYWAETWTGRVMQRDIIAPGQVAEAMPADPSVCLHGFPGVQLLDSLAVDADGNVCVATIGTGGVSVVSPSGELIDFVETGDLITTNICFGGDDLRTAYITASSTGRLLKTEWPRPGAKLHFLNS